MLQGGRILVLVIVMFFGTLTSVFSVGYEPLDESGVIRSSKRVHAKNNVRTNVSRLKRKCPVVLDETVAYVKDILAQFGLVQKSGK